MLDLQLNIQIEEPFTSLVSDTRLKRVVELVLRAAGLESPVELGLLIASDTTVHKLNQTYRSIDDTTDVLAFALSEPQGDRDDHFITPPDGLLHLGEVVVSYHMAQKQAAVQSHSVDRELSILIIHGVLHLLGYDHEHPDGRQRMRSLEDEILSALKHGS